MTLSSAHSSDRSARRGFVYTYVAYGQRGAATDHADIHPFGRRLDLDGAVNARDVGGYAALDRRRVRWRTLLRSGRTDRLTPQAVRAVVGMGVKSVIDLRADHEAATFPSALAAVPDVRYRRIPLFFDTGLLQAGRGPHTLPELYQHMLEQAQPRIADVMRELAMPGALPALITCTAGKDRTGLIAALVLGLLHVPDAVIVEDYALSGEYLAPHLDAFREMGRRAGADPVKHDAMLQAPPEAMLHALKWIRSRYSDVEGFLRVAGLSSSELNRIRAGLLE